MKEYYDTYDKSGIEHMDRSLRERWSTIQADFQKLPGCLASSEDINPSGTNDNDKVIYFGENSYNNASENQEFQNTTEKN
jgi:hypothetical protein